MFEMKAFSERERDKNTDELLERERQNKNELLDREGVRTHQ